MKPFCWRSHIDFSAHPGAHKDAGAIVDTIISKAVNCACFVPTLLVEFVNYLERNPDEADEVHSWFP